MKVSWTRANLAKWQAVAASYARDNEDKEGIESSGAFRLSPACGVTGHLPYLWDRAVYALNCADLIQGVVYSYDTPIAIMVKGVWLVPKVTYSRTSGKHRSNIYSLGLPVLVADTPEELLSLASMSEVFVAAVLAARDNFSRINKLGKAWPTVADRSNEVQRDFLALLDDADGLTYADILNVIETV